MRSAVYYPHTEISNIEFLKTALLLWDKVHLMVPFEQYTLNQENREIVRATDILCSKIVPTTSQKREAHELVEDFATKPLPASFFYSAAAGGHYMTRGVWPQKFLPETWSLLRDLNFTARAPLMNSDYPLQEESALTIMSLLADCCAGSAFARITDRGAAYASIVNLLAGAGETKSDEAYLTNEYAVVPLTLKILNVSRLPLGRIIYFREREEKERGTSLRDLRHRYADKIVAHVNELKLARRVADMAEISRQFQSDMKDDLRNLKNELRCERINLGLSKEVVLSTLALTGTAFAAMHLGHQFGIGEIGSMAGGSVTLGGLVAGGNKFFSARIATLRKHPMAYLYELERL